MKIRNHQIRRRLASVSNLLCIILAFCFSIGLFGQSEKTYEKEFSVSPGIHVESNVPTDLWIETDGTVVCDNTKDSYIVSGKNGDQRLNINKEFNIHTWDKDVVKQVVKINADLESEEAANELLSSLNLNFANNADGTLVIDANMNVEKMILKNSFFQSDNCLVILADGSQHKVNKLDIKSTLYVPKYANLTVVGSRNVTLRLDDLEGELELILSYAEVYGKSLNHLNGSFNYCYGAHFDKVNTAEVNAINSNIVIDKLNKLEVGMQKISNRCLIQSLHELKKYNSFQNSFVIDNVEEVKIYESANDGFTFKNVNSVDVIKSAFCRFNIDDLESSFDMMSKNTEVKIFNINKAFKEISMTNTLGEIFMEFEKESNYNLRWPSENYMESNLHYSIKEMSNTDKNEKFYQVGEGNSGDVYLNCDRCMLTIK